MAVFDDFISAISGQESGGNYRAVNRDSGALGRYQIMPSNVGPWAKQYLGINLTPQQFLGNPSLQDRLARAVLQDYVRRYGYQGAASAWYSGNPNLYNSTKAQGNYPSIAKYVSSIMDRMGNAVNSVRMESAGYDTVAKFNDVESVVPMMEAPEDDMDAAAQQGVGLESDSNQVGMSLNSGSPVTDGAGMSTTEPSNPIEQAGDITPMSDDVAVTTSSGGKYLNPIAGFKPSGTWGRYASGGTHLALDFAVPYGTAVRAPMGGTIVSAGWEDSGFGLAIRIKNTDGTYTILGHLSSLVGIQTGSKIEAGQIVGKVGSTGRSTGNHLHLEFRKSLYDPKSAFDFTGNMQW